MKEPKEASLSLTPQKTKLANSVLPSHMADIHWYILPFYDSLTQRLLFLNLRLTRRWGAPSVRGTSLFFRFQVVGVEITAPTTSTSSLSTGNRSPTVTYITTANNIQSCRYKHTHCHMKSAKLFWTLPRARWFDWLVPLTCNDSGGCQRREAVWLTQN